MNMLASSGQLRASVLRWALFTVPLIVLLGFLSGQLGGPDSEWFQSLTKPATFPPPAAFPIVWTILYVLIGIALALVCSAWGARARGAAIAAFVFHFLFNLAWTPVFFGAHQLTWGLIVLLLVDVTLVVVIALFWRVRRLAGMLLLPYLAWVLFATLLNWQFLQMNPQADGGLSTTPSDRVRIG